MVIGQFDHDIESILRTSQKTKERVIRILVRESDKLRNRAALQDDKLMIQTKNKSAAVLLLELASLIKNKID